MMRGMETQAEFKARVHANFEGMPSRLEELNEDERELILEQVNSYAMPLMNRLLAVKLSETTISNEDDCDSGHSRVIEAKNLKFEHNNGNFFLALKRYNDERTAGLFEVIEGPGKRSRKSKKTSSTRGQRLCGLL